MQPHLDSIEPGLSSSRDQAILRSSAKHADPNMQHSSSQDSQAIHYHPLDLSDGSLMQAGALQGKFAKAWDYIPSIPGLRQE